MSADLWEGDTRVTGEDGREQPNAVLAAERAVLGAALVRPSLVPEISAVLRDDDWSHLAHVAIWAAITDRAATGQPVDVLTVAADIGSDRALSQLGGHLYINDLANDPSVLPSAATHHAQIIADAAQGRRWGSLGVKLAQAAGSGVDDETLREWVEKHLADRNPAARAKASTWAPVDLTDALHGVDEEPPALMPRSDGPCLLYAGSIHTISGEPTAGKTWLVLHAARHELDQGNHVTLVDFEDRASRVVARLLRLGATPTQIDRQFRYIRPDIALDTTGRDALAKAVTGTTLTIVDGVTEAMALHGLDLSSNPDVAAFYALLPRWIADQGNPGPTVVMIDHVVKDGEKQSRWGIGGQHKLAGIDGAAYTVKNVEPMGRGKRGTSRVFIAKDRHGHVEEHALGRCAAEFHLDSTDPDISRATLDPPEAMPTSEGGDLRPTVLMERVSRWLEVNPGATLNAVKENVTGKGQYVAKALNQLVTEGNVATATGARNATFHTVLEPFRREPETPDDHPR
jgi:hypothetical protein